MKKLLKNKIFVYLTAFVLAIVTIFLFLYFKSIPEYFDFEQDNYDFNGIVSELNQKELSDYNISFDNIRELNEAEKTAFFDANYEFIPRHKAILKNILYFEGRSFLLRTETENIVVFYFFKIHNDIYTNVVWFEGKYDIFSSMFKVDNLDIGSLDIEEMEEATPNLFATYQNVIYGMSNLSIFILSICLIIIFEWLAHRFICSKEKKIPKSKKAVKKR